MLNVRRTVYVLVAVSLSQIILISAQVRAPSRAGMLAATTFGVFSELQRATSSVVLGVRDVWFAYVALRGVREENKRLGTELTALQVRLQEQRALVRQSLGLQRLLALRAEVPLETMGARVIAADATSWFQTLAIDRGARDGVRPDMAVIAPEGVVGRIVGQPSASAAKVQLLIDRNAAAGAMIEQSRAAGVVIGGGGELLRMDYVSNLVDVTVEDVVVTSGVDGIYPKGFVIGPVASAERGPGLYQKIQVQSAVDFLSLEYVLVVTSPPASAAAEGLE